jgi:protein TonB
MERARVLSPSLSVSAHAVFASVLVVAPLVGPQALPKTSTSSGPLELPAVSVHLPGGGMPRPGRGGPPRVTRHPGFTLPTQPAAAVPIPEPTDLTGDGLVPGLLEGDDASGLAAGFCLADCSAGGPADQTVVDPPAVAGHGPYRVGGGFLEPVRVRSVTPEYPALALAARVEGRVVIDCVIDEDGRVVEVAVLEGHVLLQAAAADAVRQWRYRPTLLNGVRVPVRLQVVVSFRIR